MARKKNPKKPKKKRLPIEVGAEVEKKLNELVDWKDKTVADVVRAAIKRLHWETMEERAKAKFFIKRPDEELTEIKIFD